MNEKPEATNAREKEQAEEPSEELVEKPAEEPDGEPAEESAEEYSAGQSAELKMVLHVEGGRASAAVWRSGADPHIETFPETGALEDLIGELPGVVERANARWAESPLRPRHDPPKAPRKKTQRSQATAGDPEPDQARTDQAGDDQPQQQTGMARLF